MANEKVTPINSNMVVIYSETFQMNGTPVVHIMEGESSGDGTYYPPRVITIIGDDTKKLRDFLNEVLPAEESK